MRRRLPTLLCAAACLLAAACGLRPIPPAPANGLPTVDIEDFFGSCLGFETGCLIFVADTAGMGGDSPRFNGSYTHVAVVVCEDSGCYIYEAAPAAGVIRSRYGDWAERLLPLLPDTNLSFLSIAHLAHFDCDYDTALLVRRLHESLGKPYDPYFQLGNGMFYGSELIYECFYDKSGRRLFHARPMDFRSADGAYPAYWLRHFDSLGIPIPQGLPGTTPAGLRREPFLLCLKIQ